MNNSPAPATQPSGQKLTLSAVLLALIGLAAWGLVSAGNSPKNDPKGTSVTQKKDALTEARALLADGRSEDARAAFEQIINDPNSTVQQRIWAYVGLGNLADPVRESDAARAYFKEAVTLVEKGKKPLLWAEIQFQFARFLKASGAKDECMALLQEIVLVREAHQGPNHPDLLEPLNEMIYTAIGREGFNDMWMIYRHIFDIKAAAMGPNHPDFIYLIGGFTDRIINMEHAPEAVPYLRQGLELLDADKEANPEEIASYLQVLTNALITANKPAEAVPYARRFLEYREKEIGVDHPRLTYELVELGKLLQQSNLPDEAEAIFQRAMEIQLKQPIPEDYLGRRPFYELAQIYLDANRLPEAEALYRKDDPNPNDDEPGSLDGKITSLTSLAQIMEKTNRLSEAEPFLRKAAEMCYEGVRRSPDREPILTATLDNYLRVGRLLDIPDDEIHRRLAEDWRHDESEQELQIYWEEMLERNPKDAVNEQPAPVK